MQNVGHVPNVFEAHTLRYATLRSFDIFVTVAILQ